MSLPAGFKPYDGSGCPVSPNTKVRIICRGDTEEEISKDLVDNREGLEAMFWDWTWSKRANRNADIIAFRTN